MASSMPDPADDPRVEVRRSGRRRSTVTAYREAGRTVVLIPARFTRGQEREWVQRMLDRLAAQERRRRPGDEELMTRAITLNDRHLRGLATPLSVTWVQNQNTRWGSCTPADRSIRLSTRLLGMPSWVLDYVLLHELAHLIEPGHGPDFWSLLNNYPRTERARGFLEGFSAARDLPVDDNPPDSTAGDPADHAEHGDQEDEPDDAETVDIGSFTGAQLGAAEHDGVPHDGAQRDGALHDGVQHDGAEHDGAGPVGGVHSVLDGRARPISP